MRNSNSRNLRARAAALRDRGRRALDDGDQGDFIASLILLPAILVFTCLLTAIPAALVVWISEVSRILCIVFWLRWRRDRGIKPNDRISIVCLPRRRIFRFGRICGRADLLARHGQARGQRVEARQRGSFAIAWLSSWIS